MLCKDAVMVQKLNNIIQSGTKFNQKVDNIQKGQKSEKFSKSLDIIISDEKGRNQKNQKIKKKNKIDHNSKSQELKQNNNLFKLFNGKNLPSISLDNYIEKDINFDNINKDESLNFTLPSDSDIEENSGILLIPQLITDFKENETPPEEISDKIEAKFQIINELFQAINSGFINNRNVNLKNREIIENNHINDTKSSIYTLKKDLKEKNFNLENNEYPEEGKIKKSEKNSNLKPLFNHKNHGLEIESKSESRDVKMSLNLPSAENKKADENIHQKVENQTDNIDIQPKKVEQKIQNSKKNSPDLPEKIILHDILKENIADISTSSKNINYITPKKTITYNQYGQIRTQEFTQTTLQLIRSTPYNTTSTANLVLKPESLGTLFVQITMTDNKAKINIMADTTEAIKSIEHQIGALKEKLSQNGIIADSIDIGFKPKEGDDKFSNNNPFTKQQDKKNNEDIKEYLKALNYFKDEEKDVSKY